MADGHLSSISMLRDLRRRSRDLQQSQHLLLQLLVDADVHETVEDVSKCQAEVDKANNETFYWSMAQLEVDGADSIQNDEEHDEDWEIGQIVRR